jgi:hypothetical protein
MATARPAHRPLYAPNRFLPFGEIPNRFTPGKFVPKPPSRALDACLLIQRRPEFAMLAAVRR